MKIILEKRMFIKAFLIQSGWKVHSQTKYEPDRTLYFYIANNSLGLVIRDNKGFIVEFRLEADAWDALIDSYIEAFTEKVPIPINQDKSENTFDPPKDIYDRYPPWGNPRDEGHVWVGKGKTIRKFEE